MTSRIAVRLGSLTEGVESVLVNNGNTNLQLGSGVGGAIRKACGPAYQTQVLELLQKEHGGPLAPGEVFITHAGTHLRAKYVAHVAVMDYRKGYGTAPDPTIDLIRTALERLWNAVEALPGDGKHSVALCSLGAGTGNLGVIEPNRAAAETLKAHWESHPHSRIEKVVFYGYREPEEDAIAKEVARHFPELVQHLSTGLQRALQRP